MNTTNQMLSNYEQPNTPLMNEKLPGIDKLAKLEENVTPSPPVPSSSSFIDTKYAYLPPPPNNYSAYPGMMYHQHMSPPLTPAVSPSSILLDSMQFKRKFSVDVGPFGFGTNIPHPSTMHDQDAYRRSSCSAMEEQQQNNEYIMPQPTKRRGSRAHQNGPTTQHKHACSYCNWSFKRYEHLKRHMLVHTGKRPHVCQYPGCGKSFSRSDNYHAHYRTHTKKLQQQKKSTTKNSNVSTVAAAAVAAAAAASVSSSTNSSQAFDERNYYNNYQDLYARPNFEDNHGYHQQNYLRNFSNDQFGLHTHHQDGSAAHSGVNSLLNHEVNNSQQANGFYNNNSYITPASNIIHQGGFGNNGYYSIQQGDESTNSIAAAAAVVATAAAASNSTKVSGRKMSNNEQKPHACPVAQCQRKFKRLEHLKRHMRIHTLERPFSCTFPNCHKTFSRSDNLSQHMKTHQRVEDRRRKQKSSGSSSSSSSTFSPDFYQQQQNLPPLNNQQQNNNTMISNMVGMSWHSTSAVGC